MLYQPTRICQRPTAFLDAIPMISHAKRAILELRRSVGMGFGDGEATPNPYLEAYVGSADQGAFAA